MKHLVKESIDKYVFKIAPILCAILFLGCGKNKTTIKKTLNSPAIEIKMAAYNVEFSKNASATEIGNMLKSYNFDVVCFSEAPGGDWTQQVGLATGLKYALVGKYSTAGHVDKYKTILSKYPLDEYEEILMTDTLHTVTKAKIKIEGREMAIYSLHFPFGEGATKKMMDFANYLETVQKEEISIALGDYNFDLKSPDCKLYMNAGLQPSWNDLNINTEKLSTWNALDTSKNEGVIDHIMYNPNKIMAIDGQIIELEKPLSDHKPVWALLRIK